MTLPSFVMLRNSLRRKIRHRLHLL